MEPETSIGKNLYPLLLLALIVILLTAGLYIVILAITKPVKTSQEQQKVTSDYQNPFAITTPTPTTYQNPFTSPTATYTNPFSQFETTDKKYENPFEKLR